MYFNFKIQLFIFNAIKLICKKNWISTVGIEDGANNHDYETLTF